MCRKAHPLFYPISPSWISRAKLLTYHHRRGLRVSQITYTDADGSTAHTRKFHHTNSSSFADAFTSGRLMAYPRYQKDYQTIDTKGVPDGYFVGYSNVFVEDFGRDGKPVGMKEYSYMNIPDTHLAVCGLLL